MSFVTGLWLRIERKRVRAYARLAGWVGARLFDAAKRCGPLTFKRSIYHRCRRAVRLWLWSRSSACHRLASRNWQRLLKLP